MLRLVLSALLALSFATLATAQDSIPTKRLSYVAGTDFVGRDLQQLFNTDIASCRRACLANSACVAFTFNARNGACFPKSEVSSTTPYEGALSARVATASNAQLARAKSRRSDLGFVQSYEFASALDQARTVARNHPNSDWTLEQLRDTAQQRAGNGDRIGAMRWAGVAIGITDSARDWLSYARYSAGILTSKRSEQRKHNSTAHLAALNSYLRAKSDSERAEALVLLAELSEKLGRGRDMIPALKLANSLSYSDRTAALLEKARGKYGFRIVDTEVDSNSATPRICASFNEALDKLEADYARFVALPDPRFAVEASGRKLCITGVEHGGRYTINLRSGLPAASGEVLSKDTRLSFYVRDRAPEVSFAGRGYILPLGGEASLPVETVNLSEVELTLRHVSDRNLLRAMQQDLFAKPLYAYEEEQLSSGIGETVWTGIGEVGNTLNQSMSTRLPIAEAIKDAPAGIYVMSARAKGASGAAASQWFVLSDIGISSAQGASGLHVSLRSLKTAAPMAGATVKLVSRSNRVLAEAQSDDRGIAQFSAALTAGKSGAAPALVLAEAGEADMAFLSLTDPAFDLSDRGVSGREAAGPIDVFLTTERGAYRAGETVYATALARSPTAEAITGLPLTGLLMRPDGVEYARQVLEPDSAGGYVAAFPVALSAPRGAWTLELRAEADTPALARETFLVEDFLPERIAFDIGLPEGLLNPNAPLSVDLNAQYLYGAPAADLKAEGRVSLRSVRSLEAYPGFVFGSHDARVERKSAQLARTKTDASGDASLSVNWPALAEVDSPMSARFDVQVSEGSGRPVERSETRSLLPAKMLLGLKPLFDGTLPEGSEALFDVIAVNPDLALIDARARWTLNRVNTRYTWYEQYGRWRWEPIVTREKLATGALDLTGGKASLTAPVTWGEFELVVELESGTYTQSSHRFSAGWYATSGAVATPDTLEMSLDKEAYTAGDTAKLRVIPQSAGQAMVQVMNESVISSQVVTLKKGENMIPLIVSQDWGAGAYVSVTHISPMESEASFLPTRAIGLAYATVDPGEKALAVSLEAPEVTKPRQPLSIRVKVDGVQAGEEAFVTLAAVDAGILGLTRFTPPDPAAHYFGKRKLGVELRDVYGRLIDASKGALGRLRSGGDAGASAGAENVPPPDELVTFFEGRVLVGADGYADVSFDIPAFNGTLRLMALAWSKSGLGSATQDVIIRDPVVLTASLPRFLAPGDASRALIEIAHAEGPTGATQLSVTADGITIDTSNLPQSVALTEGEKLRFSLPLTAGDTGDHTVRITVQTPGGDTLEKELTLPVRSLDPEVSSTRQLTLAAGDSLPLDEALLSGYRGDGRVTFTAGPIAKFDVAGLLTTLDRYPYGCTEQLTSAAMPLLYMSSVSEALGLSTGRDLPKRIEGAITRILTRQSSNGSFGLWWPSSGDAWLDAYVTDFLTRARDEGYMVPERALQSALGNLRNIVNTAPDFDSGGGGLAYALYVLAREGEASVSDLRYYADVKANALNTPIGSAHLAAALAAYGDQPRADALFGKAEVMLAKALQNTRYSYRRDYGTPKRDAAAVMALASAAGSQAVDLDALARAVSAPTRYRSTQEMVWSLLAVDALTKGGADTRVTLGGVPMSGPPAKTLTQGDLRVGTTLSNEGTAPFDVTLTSFGTPEVPPAAGGYGYAIERRYYTLEGEPVERLAVRAGERIVVHLKVTPFEKASARLMINDPLAAGFEIDNPSLLQSGSIGALGWLKPSNAQHSEFRSERFLAAVDAREGRAIELAYIIRAVTPGRYHHPAATVEDMYRPTYRANTDSGEAIISE